MPINLQGSGPITEGWGPAPQLDAPALGSLVASILANKLERDKMTQESIADTIKNVREERQSAQYLDAMKAAGLVPEGYDAGGFGGAKLGTGLAKMIQDKREFDALEKHRRAMETRVGGRGGRGSRGDGGVTPDVPEDYYGLSVAPGKHSAGPEIVEKDGVKYLVVRTSKSVTYKRVPGQTGTTGGVSGQIKPTPTERGWAAPSIPGLSVNIDAPDEPARVLPPDTPSMEDAVPQRPPAETGDALPTTSPPPRIQSDKAGGHADTYGVPPVGTIKGGYRFKGGDPKDQANWEPI